MASDVFIISTARNPDPVAALQQALELAGLEVARVQDAVFGLEHQASEADLAAILRAAGLTCGFASVSPGLRAPFFAAASMLSDDVQLSLAVTLDVDAASAFVLASPEAVGGLNLFPRARIAARSLAGTEPAVRQAGLALADVEICKAGGAALHDVLNELDARPARWGLVTDGDMALLIERL